MNVQTQIGNYFFGNNPSKETLLEIYYNASKSAAFPEKTTTREEQVKTVKAYSVAYELLVKIYKSTKNEIKEYVGINDLELAV